MIVVMPDGTSGYGCGQWVDSPVTGNFEQYVLHDVIPYVDADYRTLPAGRVAACSASRPEDSAPGISPRATPTCSATAVLSADSFLDMTHKFPLYKYLDSIWPEAPKPRRGERLVGDRLRTPRPTRRTPTTHLSRRPSGRLPERRNPGGLESLADFDPGRQRSRTPRQPAEAVRDLARRRLQRRLQLALGPPPIQPPPDRGRHLARTPGESRQSRRASERATPDGTGMAFAGPRRRRHMRSRTTHRSGVIPQLARGGGGGGVGGGGGRGEGERAGGGGGRGGEGGRRGEGGGGVSAAASSGPGARSRRRS